MHELGIAAEVIELASKRAPADRRVIRVVLEVGKLTAVMPEALRFCFELAAKDTALDGAALDIVEVPGRGKCRACSAEVPLDGPLGACPCGGVDLQWIGGQELKVRELEVA